MAMGITPLAQAAAWLALIGQAPAGFSADFERSHDKGAYLEAASGPAYSATATEQGADPSASRARGLGGVTHVGAGGTLAPGRLLGAQLALAIEPRRRSLTLAVGPTLFVGHGADQNAYVRAVAGATLAQDARPLSAAPPTLMAHAELSVGRLKWTGPRRSVGARAFVRADLRPFGPLPGPTSPPVATFGASAGVQLTWLAH